MRATRLTAGLVLAAVLSIVAAPSVFAAHAVRHSGSGTIKGTWCMDFDGGAFNAGVDAADDLCFDVSSPTERYLQTWHSADRILKMGTTRPTYSKCASATLLNTDYRAMPKLEGKWFCYKTSPGRLARFRVDDLIPYPGGLKITYTTWEL